RPVPRTYIVVGIVYGLRECSRISVASEVRRNRPEPELRTIERPLDGYRTRPETRHGEYDTPLTVLWCIDSGICNARDFYRIGHRVDVAKGPYTTLTGVEHSDQRADMARLEERHV